MDLQINVLVIIFIILIVWRIYRGFKNGLAREINGVISLFIALIVLSVVLLLIAGIMEKNIKTIILSLVFLAVVSFVYHLADLLMKSLDTIAKMPIINLVNMLLGAVAGVLEVLAIFWIMYALIDTFPLGEFGERVMQWTNESTLLTNVFRKNYIANWITGIKL